MRQLHDIERQEAAMATLTNLTSVFEGIASMRIASIKNQVLQATRFFHELWHIYSQLRVDGLFRFGRSQAYQADLIDKELYVVITAEGGFSGDIDAKLVSLMLKTYDKTKHDIIVIGHHGAIQLAQAGIGYKKYFKLPVKDQNINVTPIIKEVQRYNSTTVFYQEYVSLFIQDVKRIELLSVVQNVGKGVAAKEDMISETTYIFEPSTFAVIDHLERSMLHIAMSQLILDSKLAQYASRFRAMSNSHEKAKDAKDDLRVQMNRTRRALKDERLKEVVNSLHKLEVVA